MIISEQTSQEQTFSLGINKQNTFSLNELKNTLEWQLFQARFNSILARLEALIGPSMEHLRHSSGKGLRPLLLLTVSSLFSKPNKASVDAATAAELIHLASLVHDDIIDQAELRRGKPSLNTLYGNQASVLLEDALFAESFRLLATHDLLDSMGFFVEAIQEMCAGEVFQDKQKFDTSRSVEDYLKHISQKTAALIRACCRAGASTGGAADFEINLLANYGENLGCAFQIVDDILDYTSNSLALGKPVGNDLKEGNLTLPIIFLLEDPKYNSWFKDLLARGNFDLTSEQEVRSALWHSGALAKSEGLAISFIQNAKKCLEHFPANPAYDILNNLADSVLSHQNISYRIQSV